MQEQAKHDLKTFQRRTQRYSESSHSQASSDDIRLGCNSLILLIDKKIHSLIYMWESLFSTHSTIFISPRQKETHVHLSPATKSFFNNIVFYIVLIILNDLISLFRKLIHLNLVLIVRDKTPLFDQQPGSHPPCSDLTPLCFSNQSCPLSIAIICWCRATPLEDKT